MALDHVESVAEIENWSESGPRLWAEYPTDEGPSFGESNGENG